MLRDLCGVLRVKHYIKNGFVWIPLFFSFGFLKPEPLLHTLLAFVSFCLIASSVYILNDIADKDKDARHPVKQNRPIASGRFPVKAAVGLFGFCFLAALVLAFVLGLACLLTVLGYFVLNLLYSLRLKKVPILDVTCIAAGFVLRVLMGSFAADAPMSRWLLLTVLSMSFYLGFGKRCNEIARVGQAGQTREVLFRYSESFLRQSMTSMMTLTIILYALWTIDPAVTAKMGDGLVYTTGLVILLFLRYSYVLDGDTSHGDPTTVLLSDKPLLFGGLVYIVVMLLIILL